MTTNTPTRTPCQNEPDLWFSTDPFDVAEAKEACGHCPLADSCGGLRFGEVHGVWGGIGIGQVRQIRKRTCTHCGNTYVSKNSRQKYCGIPCQEAAYRARSKSRAATATVERERLTHVCQVASCAKSFAAKRKAQKFCSESCRVEAQRIRNQERARGRERLAELIAS